MLDLWDLLDGLPQAGHRYYLASFDVVIDPEISSFKKYQEPAGLRYLGN
jgi:hypothetical protein